MHPPRRKPRPGVHDSFPLALEQKCEVRHTLGVSEIETLHRPFAKWLDAEGILYVTPRSDRESTIAQGHPDFTLLAGGSALLIEFKVKDGKLSKEQKARIEALHATGCRVMCSAISALPSASCGRGATPNVIHPGKSLRC